MICTHGRPKTQHTLSLLRSCGYTGDIYLVVDDEDNTVEELKANYSELGAIVSMFNKEHYFQTMDKGTNENHRACILYAKGYCEDLARELGLDAFVIADDDLLSFRFRYCDGDSLKSQKITSNLDAVLEAYVEYMLSSNISATGFGFTQFYFTGVDSFGYENMQKYRVPYNFVFRNTKHRVDWLSWFGEDVISGVYYNKIGQIWTATPLVQQEIFPLATQEGGMKDVYDGNQSIRLAMQNLMYLPSEIKPFLYKGKYMAAIKRENAFPKIISGSFKK